MPLTVNRKKVVRVDIQIFVFRAIHSTSKSVKIAKMAILALFVNKLYEKQDIWKPLVRPLPLLFQKCRVKYWYSKYQNAAMKPPGIHHSRPKNCFCSFSYQVIALSFFFPKWSHPLFKSPYFKFYEHLRTGYISKYSYTMHPMVCWWNLFYL